MELVDKLSEYVCKLLDVVRGRDELEICLNKVGKENEEKYKRLARIDLALKYQEMPVRILFKDIIYFHLNILKVNKVCCASLLSAKNCRNLDLRH